MPLLLEIGLYMETYHLSPNDVGLEAKNPAQIRTLAALMNVYRTAASKQHAIKSKSVKSSSEWDRANPDGAKLLSWAQKYRKGQELTDPDMPVMPERK